MLGGSGVISVAANVLPVQMHELTSLCLANDFHAAGRLQLKLKPLCDALFCEAILDERAGRGRRYNKAMLDALPEMRTTSSLRAVTKFLRELKPESYFEVCA